MKNYHSDTHISDEAIGWFSKLSEGNATAEYYQNFDAWRNQSPSHAKAYADIERLWGKLGAPADRVFEKQRRLTLSRPKTVRPFKPGIRLVGGFAMVVLLLAITGFPESLRFLTADYSTHWGEQREISLADGSHLSLNTHSAVSVDFSPEQRTVSLLAGEAYFQVAHDNNRPFIVTTEYGQVEVTGTAFNVYAHERQMTVTVAQGQVRVYKDTSKNDEVVLAAGQQTTGDRQGIAPSTVADADQALAWRQGLLMFTLQPLSTVVDELNRYTSGRIVIADPSIRQRIVSGTFDLTRPADILPIIEKTLNISSVNIADTLTLLY